MKFLLFIFWGIVIFYLIGLVGRLLIGGFIRRKSREFEKNFRSREQQQRPKQREGDVRVEQIKRMEKQVSRKVGEYVDYEEIKEE